MILKDIMEDAPKDTTKVVLERVAAMVAIVRDEERRLSDAEADAKRHKAALFKLQSVDLPELLREAGLTAVTLEDGTAVKITDEVTCGITQDNLPAAHKWLRDNGFGALIKSVVSVAFGKDDYAAADTLAEQLEAEFGVERVDQKEAVHSSTLKAWVKERMAAGAAPPFDLFSINPYSMTKIVGRKS